MAVTPRSGVAVHRRGDAPTALGANGLPGVRSACAVDVELLPAVGRRRIGMDGVGGPTTTTHSGEEVPVDGADRIHGLAARSRRKLRDGEFLPTPQLRGVGVDDVGGPSATAYGGEIVPIKGTDTVVRSVTGVDEQKVSQVPTRTASVWITSNDGWPSPVNPPLLTAVT